MNRPLNATYVTGTILNRDPNAKCPCPQGYGATETTACTTVQECFPKDGRTGDIGGGRVGAIQPNTKLLLVSVPEMGYLNHA